MHEFLNTCILYYILMNMSIPKMNKNAVFIIFSVVDILSTTEMNIYSISFTHAISEGHPIFKSVPKYSSSFEIKNAV